MADGLELHIDVDAEAVIARFGELAGEKFEQALQRGMVEGLDYAASQVVMMADPAEHSRTGTLLNSVVGELDEPENLSGFVGVPTESPASKYAYLLTDEVKTITPVEAQALTIPIAANLTAAGAPTYPTVAALAEAFPGKVHRRGRAIGIEEAGVFEAYFGLAASVTVQGWDVLEPGVAAAYEEMVGAVQGRVDELTAKTD